jgi:hypothetical protein
MAMRSGTVAALVGGASLARISPTEYACVALSARQIRRRAAKAYQDIRLSRPTLEMPKGNPKGPVEEADQGASPRFRDAPHRAARACPGRLLDRRRHIQWEKCGLQGRRRSRNAGTISPYLKE